MLVALLLGGSIVSNPSVSADCVFFGPGLLKTGVSGIWRNGVLSHIGGSTDLGKAVILRFRGFKSGDISLSSSCSISTSVCGGV